MSSNESSNATNSTVQVDVAIIGGGIAGLWTLNRLVASGRNAILFERDTLGGVQTVAAQGVLHGGIKYTLKGSTNKTSETIAAMPERWRACLDGHGEIDLGSVPVLSEFQVMWSPATLGASLTAFFASKTLKSRVAPYKATQSDDVFWPEHFTGSAYKIHEQVVHVPALVDALAAPHRDRIFRGEANLQDDGSLRVGDRHIDAACVVTTAGAGTEQLLRGRGPAMQRRPLHQVMVTGDLPFLYGVCLGTGPKPRLVATTHPGPNGQKVWYLGGNLAETGVERSETEQIDFARSELEDLFPWITWDAMTWSTLRVDRAEPATEETRLPSGVFCEMVAPQQAAHPKLIVTWPTKLVLAPLLADAIASELATMDLPEQTAKAGPAPQLDLPRPATAQPAWIPEVPA